MGCGRARSFTCTATSCRAGAVHVGALGCVRACPSTRGARTHSPGWPEAWQGPGAALCVRHAGNEGLQHMFGRRLGARSAAHRACPSALGLTTARAKVGAASRSAKGPLQTCRWWRRCVQSFWGPAGRSRGGNAREC